MMPLPESKPQVTIRGALPTAWSLRDPNQKPAEPGSHKAQLTADL